MAAEPEALRGEGSGAPGRAAGPASGWQDLDRHDLVSVRPDAPVPALATLPRAARRAWEAAGRPLVVRRGPADEGLPLGLPLPPRMGKARLALHLDACAVVPRPSPGADDVLGDAPPGWRPTLRAAAALGRAWKVRVTPYGGLLWQALTGLPYLHVASDLDLLWRAAGPVPAGFLAGLSQLATAAPMRLDGEIVVAGHGVQWRELAAAGPREAVLCRTRAGVASRPAGAMRAP